MIIISVRIFGIPLGSWHIKLGFDLPVEDYKTNIGVLQLELTTGPRTTPVPAHAEEMTRAATPNVHEEAAPEVTQSLDTWN